MILEVAILDVKPDRTAKFEADFYQAQTIIASIPGYLGHELKRCLEKQNRYILLVRWMTLAAHTENFRSSADYQQWKALLHHYYDPFPTVEHYEEVVLPAA